MGQARADDTQPRRTGKREATVASAGEIVPSRRYFYDDLQGSSTAHVRCLGDGTEGEG